MKNINLRLLIRQALQEGSWVTITNDAGEPIGKEYQIDSSDPEYYERDEDEYGGGGEYRSRKGAFTSQKSGTINHLRDELKNNDIYSRISMGYGRSGRYVYIPYKNGGITVQFPIKNGTMNISVGSKIFNNASDAVSFILNSSEKEGFTSQAAHQATLKSGSKVRKQEKAVEKVQQSIETKKQEDITKKLTIPSIAKAIAGFGLNNKGNYKVIYGNIPAKLINSIQDFVDSTSYEELRQVKEIIRNIPKFYEGKIPKSTDSQTVVKENFESFVKQEIRKTMKKKFNENYASASDFADMWYSDLIGIDKLPKYPKAFINWLNEEDTWASTYVLKLIIKKLIDLFDLWVNETY